MDPPQKAFDKIAGEINHGNLVAALLDVDRAIARYGAKSQEWNWRLRLLKAQILISQSAPKQALKILDGELPAELAKTDIAFRKVLLEGIAYRATQEFEKAEKKLAEAEHLAESFQPQLLSEALNAEGALDIAEHKHDLADETLRRALGLARQEKNLRQEASILVNLGLVATKRERFDEAIDSSQAALQLSRTLGMQSLVATIQGNLGWAYFELGDFENALEFYKQGAESSERSGLSGYSEYWFSGVANSYIALHDYDSSEALAKRTLDRARSLNNAETITACLDILAEIALNTGRIEEAEKYNQEAIRLEEQGQDHFAVLESLLLSGRIAMGKGQFDEAEKLFRRVLDDPGADAPLRWDVQARLAGLHDATGLPVKAEAEYRKSLDTIETTRSSIDRYDLRLSFLSGGIEFYDEYINFLIRHKRPADALRVAELSRASTLSEGLSTGIRTASRQRRTARPEQVAASTHSTLLFYWMGEKQSHMWVITPTNTEHFTMPPASKIDQLVKTYRGAIVNSRDVLATEERLTGEKLYAMLIAPAQKLIPANSRIILLPDGSLYGLNFETLIVPESTPHYWIEDVTLSTASSLTMLAAAGNRPPAKTKNLLLVGNTKEANTAFPALSQSAVEMRKIEQYFPEPRRAVLEGARATPSAYLSSNPERFSYVHFVTHGTASRTRPLESAVILSAEGDSYKLYARDIVTRHLRAELVTISACYGSGSRAYSGEGLVGLSWAFLYAGAHNVIGALWEVADAPATPELMDSLYHELNQGKDPATALRAAKLQLLHSGNVFAKPFYWAPFQLYAGM
jgi:CHAT domain-containing protein